MWMDIRLATGEDAHRVASFLTELHETRHGIGSAGSLEIPQRLVAGLLADDEALTVFISESTGALQGVAAVRHAITDGACELFAIQANDSVRGRGVAQTLLRHLVENCASRGGDMLTTSVPSSDVRARGFLRRDGFIAAADELATASPVDDAVIMYALDVEAALARVTRPGEHAGPTDS
ncbi:GNAT family N-acetyltransferase [Demequina lutea]|uniref:Ribosomal protein S18 acetylase RimI-like enzyme n=1 Tax=Demequina lutea TaxID=431489 RepID=A0A7Z0CG65_9MICO|nr:GNAT family N-acetyltransferase [Demequina lutea]NYI40051.1 ribosomal protein S18 acetylase RimI-like enzyme [Demequina lutea]